MKLFCANAFTGEDVQVVTKRMHMVVEALTAAGHEPYCPVFDPHKIALQQKQDTKAIFGYAFDNIAQRDGLVAIIASDKKSEGMLMEIGAALATHKPVYLFIRGSAQAAFAHLLKLATKTFVWDSEETLAASLVSLKT